MSAAARHGERARGFGRSCGLSAWLLVGMACGRDPPRVDGVELLAVSPPGSIDQEPPSLSGALPGNGARGLIRIDGSSTVYPIVEAVAEEFRARHRAHVAIAVSGTRGGLERLCQGQIEISGASRPMRRAEAAECRAQGVRYVELPLAYDGIAVAVHPENGWATALTVAELAALWRPEAQRQVVRWSQIRAGWPDVEIHLLGPGVDSGTYDSFTLAIVGREHASRGDYGASEDHHLIARGVSSDPLALGFLGYAYYTANRDRLRLVGIDDQRDDNGRGPIWPSPETVRKGSYSPLSRPLFLYVSLAAAARPEVAEWVRFCLQQAGRLAPEVGYIALSDASYGLARQRFEAKVEGSLFGDADARLGLSVEPSLVVE